MSDNLENRGPQDASKVNVGEVWEVAYWTKKFGVSADELKQAVKQVGTSAEALGQHFRK
jgi:ribosomal protein L11